MHSSEVTVAPASGPALLVELGKLIIRARSTSPARRLPQPRDRLLHAKLIAANPSTSQIQNQPKPELEETRPAVEVQLNSHVDALWKDQIPVCIEVLLAPNCPECYTSMTRCEETGFDKHTQRGLLLERWTMRALVTKTHESPAFITSQWLLNAVRSQLHFSQLSAWLARLKKGQGDEDATERRRKLSRETCNFKKLEANCDEPDLAAEERKLNVVYSIKIPGESYKTTEFSRPPTDHTFPVTDIGNNIYLKVNLESLPRIDDIPTVKCICQKRRASKEVPINVHEELVSKLNDLTLDSKYETLKSNIGCSTRRLSFSNGSKEEFRNKDVKDDKHCQIVDDRMHTTCSESGKHKCSCDDESDLNQRSSTSISQPKKLDEKRLKEIAKYKRRLRKESKLKKLCDSTSSEGDTQKAKETHTSIPILQAARFDRFKAIGCYRNQTYLTLPASRIECRSPFVDSVSIPPNDFKKSVTVATQTEDIACECGNKIAMTCDGCSRGMVRSEASYNIASLEKDAITTQEENGVRRKCEDDEKSFKKLKCDLSSNLKCDNNNIYSNNISNLVVGSSSTDFNDSNNSNDLNETSKCESNEDKSLNEANKEDGLIRRPKLRRFFPIVDKIEKIVADRLSNDIKGESNETPRKKETKRQKTYSINDEDYVLYEKCDYGTIDRCEIDSPVQELNGFKFPEDIINSKTENQDSCSKDTLDDQRHKHTDLNYHDETKDTDPKDNKTKDTVPNEQITKDLKNKAPDAQVPSSTEMDRFRYRFDSAASMVFHTKTGLPLTSSPAPLKRGNNCFDFDDSINGVSGIKSALFHPVACLSPAAPRSAPPPPAPRLAPPASANNDTATYTTPKLRMGPSAGLLGSFEESALKGRLEPVATVHGFTADLGASGAFCPPHRKLPVTVFFYAPGGTNAPYMGHINLGPGGYRVARSGTIQVSLFNPHGTLVKMFVVLYDLTSMPANARTFLRQRTLYMPAGADAPRPEDLHKWLRYLIHLRFMTSKSGKLYLHTDIRIIVSRKADVDTATAHSALFRPIPTNRNAAPPPPTNHEARNETKDASSTNERAGGSKSTNRGPNRVFGGSSEFDTENKMREIGYENQNGVSYELRSFTYAPENPKYSPR